MLSSILFFTDMKYVLVTGQPVTGLPKTEAAQMEVISEDGTTVICQHSKNSYPENVYGVSGAVIDGTIIVACGGQDGKFF